MFKKVISLLMVLAVIAMIGCVYAAADEISYADSSLNGCDSRVAIDVSVLRDTNTADGATGTGTPEDAIKELLYEANKDQAESPDDVLFEEFENPAEGVYVFTYMLRDMTYSDIAAIVHLGDYAMTYSGGRPFYIYTGGDIIELEVAYNRGLVTDEIMDKLVESSVFFDIFYKADDTDGEDPEDPATPDEVSTPDQVDKNAKSGPAIQTGVAFPAIFLLLMIECVVVAIVYRRKLNNIQ